MKSSIAKCISTSGQATKILPPIAKFSSVVAASMRSISASESGRSPRLRNSFQLWNPRTVSVASPLPLNSRVLSELEARCAGRGFTS